MVLGHEDGQVAHHLGRGRHLHDVAQHLVDLAVILLDLHEAAAQAQGLHLGLEVGVLAAGDLIAVDVGVVAGEAALKGVVALAHVLPVVGQQL